MFLSITYQEYALNFLAHSMTIFPSDSRLLIGQWVLVKLQSYSLLQLCLVQLKLFRMFQPICQWNFQVLMVLERLFWVHLDEFCQILNINRSEGRIPANHLPGKSSISDSLNSSSIRFCAFPFSRHCFDNFEIIFIKTFDRRLNLFIRGQFTNFIKFIKRAFQKWFKETNWDKSFGPSGPPKKN